MSTHHLIILALETAIEELRKDLAVLEPMMKSSKSGMFITHDNHNILVHAERAFKAYIPKKYSGFDVTFMEWNGEELSLHIDELIELNDNEKHRIFVS